MANKMENISSPSHAAIDTGKTILESSMTSRSSTPTPPSDLLKIIESSLLSTEEEPLFLLESSGDEKICSIFKVPAHLTTVNPESYNPKFVSIGPYHHGKKELQMIQQHKRRFLKLFLDRAKQQDVEEKDLFKAVLDLEAKIRVSYSGELCGIKESDLISVMILDGCFLLMLFLVLSGNYEPQDNDPIFTIPWILPALRNDILLLENQVPLFVLRTLWETSKIGRYDLNMMVFDFFNYSSIHKPDIYWAEHKNLDAKHLLDLIRKTFIQPNIKSPGKKLRSTTPLILSAKRLRLQGIKFGLKKDADSILDIKLERNKLQIPVLRLDGFISSLFLNCVAFEQCSNESSNHITSYIIFMGCLIKREDDATFLSNDKRIIENYLGNEKEVSEFFKRICKGITFDISQSYLLDVLERINKYTSKGYNGVWARFRNKLL